jgi:hypothetical protein
LRASLRATEGNPQDSGLREVSGELPFFTETNLKKKKKVFAISADLLIVFGCKELRYTMNMSALAVA